MTISPTITFSVWGFELIIIIVLAYLLYRALKKLFQFDSLFELLSHDIDTNLKYFAKLSVLPLFSNSQEIQSAHNNMKIMALRLNEYLEQMETLSNKTLKLVEEKLHNPPVVA